MRAVGLSLLSMAFPAAGLTVPRDVSIYAAMALTIYSGAIYLAAAWKSIVA